MDVSEADRVKAVQALQIIGSGTEPEFDRIARLAGHVAHADYAHVCFIDNDHQFVKAVNGLVLPQYKAKDQSICIDVVASNGPVVIENLAADSRPKCQQIHREHSLSSYVGVPIRLTDGFVVGAVAAMSFESGLLSKRRLAALQECAGLVTRELLIRNAASEEVRRLSNPVAKQVAATPDLVRAITRNHLSVLKSVSDGVVVVRADGTINFVNQAAEQMLGRPAASMIGSTFARKLNVSVSGTALGEHDCPVAAGLRDGKERLIKNAYFLGAQWNIVKVNYAICPVNAKSGSIGAIVVFRKVTNAAPSNGVELRSTLREVSKLKQQIARLEAAEDRAEHFVGTDLPDLRIGQVIEFEDLVEAIRQEQASQGIRAQALNGGRVAGLSGAAALVEGRSEQHVFNSSGDVQVRAPSRIERWLEC